MQKKVSIRLTFFCVVLVWFFAAVPFGSGLEAGGAGALKQIFNGDIIHVVKGHVFACHRPDEGVITGAAT